MKRGGLRISGGGLRGRHLAVPDGVRPSSSRLREALFDVWREALPGSRFVDLFAGSGCVGFEALSRGAASVLLVESRTAVLRVLRRNGRAIAAAGWRIERRRLPEGLGELAGPARGGFDLAFADPPYAFRRFAELLLGVAPLLAEGGELALEHRAGLDSAAWAEALEHLETRAYGESRLSFFRRPRRDPG